MKNGRLILGGGGNENVSYSLDEKYMTLLKKNAKVLYIPAAMNRDRAGFEKCREWVINVFTFQKRPDVAVTMLLVEDETPEFTSFDSIYIGGGNTYRLLDYVHKKNLAPKFREYLDNGGVIYGGSAGAIIFGRNIRAALAEKENYTRDDGLDFLQGTSLDCHYTPAMRDNTAATAKTIGGKIIALPENAGLITDARGNILETIGTIFTFTAEGKLI